MIKAKAVFSMEERAEIAERYNKVFQNTDSPEVKEKCIEGVYKVMNCPFLIMEDDSE